MQILANTTVHTTPLDFFARPKPRLQPESIGKNLATHHAGGMKLLHTLKTSVTESGSLASNVENQ